MISILNKFRKREISGKYLKYAAGEIILIVTGILIAISLNNWAEQRKNSRYELQILAEIHQSMKGDRSRIDEFMMPRIETMKAALAQLMEMSGKGQPVSEAEFIRLISEARSDIFFSYGSGPYESLKNRGLGSITNKDLRAKIIDFYESFLPRFTVFIHDGDDYQFEKIEQLLNELFTYLALKNTDGEWELHPKLTVESPLNHSAFLEFLNIQVGREMNYTGRLAEIIDNYEYLISEIEAELSR